MTNTKQALLTRAAQHRQAGELPQAEALCLQVVQAEPHNGPAWNLLGMIAFQNGKLDLALDVFRPRQGHGSQEH